jgi:hypothetical protein
MEQAELNHWTLREFSEKLTGKRWADDDMEAARRVLSNPEKASQALAEVGTEQRGEVLRELAQDPEVASAAFDRTDHMTPGSTTGRALGNIAHARIQGDKRRLTERQAAMPPAARELNERIGQTGARLELDEATLAYKTACRKFAEVISAALPKAGPYQGSGPLGLDALVRETAEDHATAGRLLAVLVEYVSGDQPGSSLDDEIATLLGGA